MNFVVPKTEARRMPETFRDEPGGTMGTEDLCAWRVAPRTYWIQTRQPEFARKLQRRGDTRLVAWSVAGGYLRTYVISAARRDMVRNLLKRYLGVTNEQVSRRRTPRNAASSSGVSRQRKALSGSLADIHGIKTAAIKGGPNGR